MKRRRLSPPRLRPIKIDTAVHRIVDDAAKIVMEYNQIQINNIMQSHKDNREKVQELMRLSKTRFPKLIKSTKNRKIVKQKESKKVAAKKVLEGDEDTIVIEGKKPNSVVSQYSATFTGSKEKGVSHTDVNNLVDQRSLASMSHKSGTTSGSKKNDNKSQTTVSHSRASDATEKEQSELEPAQEVIPINKVEKRTNVDKKNDNKSQTTVSHSRASDEIEKELSELEPVQEIIPINKVEKRTNVDKNKESTFRYEIEIKTGVEENTNIIGDVFLILNGEAEKSTEKLSLREYFKPNTSDALPFQRENIDKFEIYSPDYMGTIQNVVIGLDHQSQEYSWFLEYICIKDSTSNKNYRFPCRRWIGKACVDQLTEVKLGYTPPYKKDNHLSNSVEDTIIVNENSSSSSKRSLKPDKVGADSLTVSEGTTSQRSGILNSQRSSSIESDNLQSSIIADRSEPDVVKVSSSKSPVLLGKSIHSAILTHDLERVKDLCSFYDMLKNSVDSDGNAPIHLAAICYQDNDICRKIIQYLISSNVDPNIKSSYGCTPFLLAVLNGNLESVKYLNETVKVKLDERDDRDNTALHLATWSGFDVIVKYLLSNGADISAKNGHGETPMEIAERKNFQPLITLFNERKYANECSTDVEETSSEVQISEKNDERSVHPTDENECEEEIDEKHGTESEVSFLDVEQLENDNHGIPFNKRFSAQHLKSKLSDSSSNLSNLRNVHFENASSSIPTTSNSVPSACSSALSSSLTDNVYDSSLESVDDFKNDVAEENREIDSTTPMPQMLDKETQSPELISSRDSPVESKGVDDTVTEIRKTEMVQLDSTDTYLEQTTVNET